MAIPCDLDVSFRITSTRRTHFTGGGTEGNIEGKKLVFACPVALLKPSSCLPPPTRNIPHYLALIRGDKNEQETEINLPLPEKQQFSRRVRGQQRDGVNNTVYQPHLYFNDTRHMMFLKFAADTGVKQHSVS